MFLGMRGGLSPLGFRHKAAVASVFSPTSLSGLAWWLKADAITGLSNGDAIATWADSSGNGRNATQTDAARRPTFTLLGLNGKPTVRFNGTSHLMNTSYAPTLGDFTLFMVFRPLGVQSGAAARIIDKDYINGCWLGSNSSGATNSWGGGVQQSAAPFGMFLNLSNSNAHILCSTRSGTAYTLFGDGNTVSANATVSSSNMSANPFAIGAVVSNVGHYLGDIAEMVLFSRALTSEERGSMNTYLGGRWGIPIT